MWDKLKRWFYLNRPTICIALFLTSIVLTCFNLFKGLHNIELTFTALIIFFIGLSIMIYDVRKK